MSAGKWLAIVIAILVLLGGGYVTWRLNKDRQDFRRREALLKDDLSAMRRAIEKFHADQHRYPHALAELVPHYLRSIPTDPITHSAETWRVETEESVEPSADFTTSTAAKTESFVVDVHSGAAAPYSGW